MPGPRVRRGWPPVARPPARRDPPRAAEQRLWQDFVFRQRRRGGEFDVGIAHRAGERDARGEFGGGEFGDQIDQRFFRRAVEADEAALGVERAAGERETGRARVRQCRRCRGLSTGPRTRRLDGPSRQVPAPRPLQEDASRRAYAHVKRCCEGALLPSPRFARQRRGTVDLDHVESRECCSRRAAARALASASVSIARQRRAGLGPAQRQRTAGDSARIGAAEQAHVLPRHQLDLPALEPIPRGPCP